MNSDGAGLVACRGCTPASLAPFLIGLQKSESELFEFIPYSRLVNTVSSHELSYSSVTLNMAMASRGDSSHINMAQIMVSFLFEGATCFNHQTLLHADSTNDHRNSKPHKSSSIIKYFQIIRHNGSQVQAQRINQFLQFICTQVCLTCRYGHDRKLTSYRASQGGGMLGPYIYDTSSASDMQYQGPPMTIDQRRQGMSNYLGSFDQQFAVQGGQAGYQQSYASARR